MNDTSTPTNPGTVQEELKGWNWGAFLLSWVWGLGNKTYIALLGLIPGVNLVIAFILGAKGNQWAWNNRNWESVEQFKLVQKIWSVFGVGMLAGFLLGVIVVLLLVAYLVMSVFF
jgi:hypothetical protein